jgi:hypothetical protein
VLASLAAPCRLRGQPFIDVVAAKMASLLARHLRPVNTLNGYCAPVEEPVLKGMNRNQLFLNPPRRNAADLSGVAGEFRCPSLHRSQDPEGFLQITQAFGSDAG